jgi:DNA modification methylase
VSRPGDLWLPGPHRVICGDATSPEVVGRLLGERKPRLMITDPPYGIELDSEWRDRAGLNGKGAAEPSYMKRRTAGHSETTISGDTRADWCNAFALVPSIEAAYVWHASKFTREVLDGLLRIGFLHHQQIIRDKGRTVLIRTLYWFQHEPCWFVRKKNAPWYGKAGENSTIWTSPSPKFIMGASEEEKFDHPTQKPFELMRRPILNHLRRGELVFDPFLGSGTTLAAAHLTERVCYGLELDPKYSDVIVSRWQSLSGAKATLDGDGRTFEEVASAGGCRMIRVRRRVEILEQALMPPSQAEPHGLVVQFVNQQREVVSSFSVQFPRPVPVWMVAVARGKAGVMATKRETPPGGNTAAPGERNRRDSRFDAVAALAVFALGGRDDQTHLLADRPGQETRVRSAAASLWPSSAPSRSPRRAVSAGPGSERSCYHREPRAWLPRPSSRPWALSWPGWPSSPP